MRQRPIVRSSLSLFTALLASLLVTVSAFAQLQTGNIFGTVKGADGAVLPGVTVTLSGVGAPQTTVTDETGRFRFISLSPATYTLKAELAGYGTASRSGVTVNIGRNADVEMKLSPSISDAIVVTSDAPLLDTRKTGTGNDVPRVELEKIPSARDPWVILQQTPGVSMDRNNVGGNESGQQSVYVSKGTVGTQATWNVDGVNVTDFAATGSSPSYYDFDSFEEMQITTGGSDPRIMTPGVQLNMVTKRGTNDFNGSARYYRTSNAWQADPRIPSEASSYLARVNEINGISDAGGEVGGPIIKDKLWFWGGYGKQNINILSASIVAGARFQDKTLLKNENLKFNAQPWASNSLTFVDQFGDKIKLGRNVSTTRFPASAWNQDNRYDNGTGSLTDPTLLKVEDTQLFGSNLYFTGLVSKVQGGFQLIADNGKGCRTFDCGMDTLPAYISEADGGAFERSYLSVEGLRPQTQYRLDGSAFLNTGAINHELKFGYGYREAKVTSRTAWPGGEYTDLYSETGGTDVVALQRFPLLTFFSKSTDAYIGDTMLLGNLTVQAALRFDQQKGGNSAGVAQANPVIPEVLPTINFDAATGLTWRNVSPRIGITYALGADRRTLLRAGYNRYVDQMSATTVTPTSAGAYSLVYYYFNDLNHDKIAQHDEIDFDYGPLAFGGFDPSNPTASTAFTRWDHNLKAPTTDEILLGGEREILTNFSVGVNLTYRKLRDFIGTYGEKHQGQSDFLTSADYVQAAPVTATLPNGQTRSLTYYQLAPGVAVPVYSVIRNIPDYSQTYKGLELNLIKRMSNRWMMRGNLTLQDWTQDAGPGASADPTLQRTTQGSGFFTACLTCDGSVIYQSTGSGSKGNVYINSKWSTSLTGLYQIPIVETSLGFNLNSRQGYALPYVWLVRPPTGEGTKALIATEDVDSVRLPNVTQLDMNLSKDFRVHGVGFTVSVDAFNILNSNTILQRNVTQLNSQANVSTPALSSNRVAEVMSPRVFRLGARFSF
ncbi:MAG: TonB-dependent receptor [Acidobacteria bacterium]|nr:TonB-dependent receptor [Acidobacteriota bacterium]MBV9477239.1 TonB-dependent receptor [Acidobacteriota bacterium]